MFYASVKPYLIRVDQTRKKSITQQHVEVEEDKPVEFFSTSLTTETERIAKIKEEVSAKAQKHLERALGHIREADESKSQELYALAGKCLDKAIFLTPNYDYLYSLKGRCLAEVGDHTTCLKYFNIAAKINPKNSSQLQRAKLVYAQSLCDNKKYSEARAIVENCLEKDPDYCQGWLLLVEITGFDGSKQEYDTLLEQFVGKFGETEGLLNVMMKRVKNGESIYHSDLFLRMSLNYGQVKSLEIRAHENHNLAKRFLLSNKSVYALNQITSALKLCPMDSHIHITKGVILERMGHLGKAAAAYLEAYRLSLMGELEDESFGRHMNRLLNRLAVRYIGQGLWEEALDLLNLVIQTSQAYQFYLNRAQCLQKMGEYEMAIEDYNEAIEHVGGGDDMKGIKERLSHCYFEFGVRELRNGKAERADLCFTKSIELAAKQEYYFERSKCHFEQKKFELAVADMVSAVELMEYPNECIKQLKLALSNKFNNNFKSNNVCNRLLHHHK